jgi:hypothetical protein
MKRLQMIRAKKVALTLGAVFVIALSLAWLLVLRSMWSHPGSTAPKVCVENDCVELTRLRPERPEKFPEWRKRVAHPGPQRSDASTITDTNRDR